MENMKAKEIKYKVKKELKKLDSLWNKLTKKEKKVCVIDVSNAILS
jgi:hypothetical protein